MAFKIMQNKKKIEKNATYVVTKEIVKNVIEISGTVEAAKSQSLQAAADGMVMAVYANEGDSVKKGQVLVELDTSSQEYDIAKIDYDIAQTRINGNPKELELKLIQKKSLEKKLLIWNIKSTTKAQEGLYMYDTIQRLYDGQFGENDVHDIKEMLNSIKEFNAKLLDFSNTIKILQARKD